MCDVDLSLFSAVSFGDADCGVTLHTQVVSNGERDVVVTLSINDEYTKDLNRIRLSAKDTEKLAALLSLLFGD